MISPYLGKPIRNRPRAIADMLDNCEDTYVIVTLHGSGPCFTETQVGETKADVIARIAGGEYDNAVAVLRVSLSDKTENVSEDIASEVIALLDKEDRLFDEEGDCLAPDFVYDAWSGAEEAIQEILDNRRGEAEHVATESNFARRY